MLLGCRFAAGLAVLFAATAATAAQSDPLTSVAGGLDVFGQGLGEAAQSGQYVFVTATGHSPTVAASIAVVRLSVKRRNASAVAAVRERDRAVEAVMAQAQRLGLQAALGKMSLERGGLAMPHIPVGGIPPLATTPSTPVRPPPAVQDYTADAEIDVSGPVAAKQAELLDALQGANVDVDVLNGPIVPAFSIAGFSAGGVGAGVDSASIDRAMDEAVAEARRQAARLAADAGRSLGPAVQITLLARSAAGREATATVAVRFALAPQH
ncbi:MAG: SIMPL domain-containing protein [Caulobacteraceae bacterium]|nr:SIMPL domain-containing protein [Caulobacteraceae bacterium]